jgi:hypothetical protein
MHARKKPARPFEVADKLFSTGENECQAKNEKFLNLRRGILFSEIRKTEKHLSLLSVRWVEFSRRGRRVSGKPRRISMPVSLPVPAR